MYKLFATNEFEDSDEVRVLGEYHSLEEAAAGAIERYAKRDIAYASANHQSIPWPEGVVTEDEVLSVTDSTTTWHWCEEAGSNGDWRRLSILNTWENLE